MATVFFEDKFYEAPEGSTSLDYCANCKLVHNSCSECPWKMVDMSKAVEIDAIKKEDCLNYAASPQGRKFYYSRGLEGCVSGSIRRPLVYCEGSDVNGWAKIAISFDNYAAGFNIDIKSLKKNMCSNCEDKQDCIKCGNYEDIEAFAHCVYMEYHTGITYNNVHFDKEIPKDIWNSCVNLMREFNKTAYDLIMKNSTVLSGPAEWKKGMFLFNDDKRFPYHNITANIYYTTTNVSTCTFAKNVEYYIETIDYDAYSCYGKDSHYFHQLHEKDKPCRYVVPESVINEIIDIQKEMDNKIEKLIEPYVK